MSVKERDELLKTGKVSGWVGHHVNSVAAHDLEMASNPNNVKFVKGMEEHLEEHGGDWRNATFGPLIDRIAQLGGPALLAFFVNYDKALEKLLKECELCSDDDSWLSYVNPFNDTVELTALGLAYDKTVKDYKNQSKPENSDEWQYGPENAGPDN